MDKSWNQSWNMVFLMTESLKILDLNVRREAYKVPAGGTKHKCSTEIYWIRFCDSFFTSMNLTLICSDISFSSLFQPETRHSNCASTWRNSATRHATLQTKKEVVWTVGEEPLGSDDNLVINSEQRLNLNVTISHLTPDLWRCDFTCRNRWRSLSGLLLSCNPPHRWDRQTPPAYFLLAARPDCLWKINQRSTAPLRSLLADTHHINKLKLLDAVSVFWLVLLEKRRSVFHNRSIWPSSHHFPQYKGLWLCSAKHHRPFPRQILVFSSYFWR